MDSIINSKLHSVDELSISVNTDILVPKKMNIDSVDLAVLLGNLLDNAIEGCLTVENHRFIDLKLHFENNQLKLKVSNPFDGTVKKQGDRILSRKEDKEMHGYGLTSIQRIVDKYQGFKQIEYTDEVFTMTMILNEVITD